jgi:GAF domain-containing protein
MTSDELTSTATRALQRLAAMSLSEESLTSVLQTVVDLTRQVLPEGVEVSVSVLGPDRPRSVVSTDALALDLDEVQYERGHGPALHAVTTGRPVEVVDTRTESRWPDQMQRATALGCRSSLSVPLGSPDVLPAGLNVYARQPAAFDPGSRDVVTRFARFAGGAAATMDGYRSARAMADDLQVALQHRATIDEATAVLRRRYRLTPAQAYHLLARTSVRTRQELRAVAAHVVRTGELLGTRPRR